MKVVGNMNLTVLNFKKSTFGQKMRISNFTNGISLRGNYVMLVTVSPHLISLIILQFASSTGLSSIIKTFAL